LGHKAKWEYFRALYERYHRAGSEALDAERILSEHRLPPEICDSTSEWSSSRKATGATAAWTASALRPASAFYSGGDLGSGGISLVGAVEGAAAELAAVDS